MTAYQEKSVTNVRLQELTNKHSQEINKLLSDLVEEGLLLPQGVGRGTTYVLSDTFTDNDEDILGNNEEMLGNSQKL